jgi:alpha-soluble NSF attachment protein
MESTQRTAAADELVRKAEEKSKKKGFLGWGATSNKEEASEMFHQAGVDYKVSSRFDLSGQAFMRCAEMHSILKNRIDECSAYVEAANAFKQCDTAAAVNAFDAAAQMSMDMNRISQAAKHFKEIGELHEKDFQWRKSTEALKKAAEFFQMENQSSNANGCLLKVAQFKAQYLAKEDPSMWASAIQIFEKIGKESAGNNLLKYSAKKYFFAAGLCRLAAGQSVVEVQDALNEYQIQDVSFKQQRENELLEFVVQAVDERDVELFQQKLTGYDNFTKLDPFQTGICLQIKRNIEHVDLDAVMGGQPQGDEEDDAAGALC